MIYFRDKHPRFYEKLLSRENYFDATVIVDRETGVNYLYVTNSHKGAGLTVLVDENGKPIITKDEDVK